jgi:anti-anti-sigma factor
VTTPRNWAWRPWYTDSPSAMDCFNYRIAVNGQSADRSIGRKAHRLPQTPETEVVGVRANSSHSGTGCGHQGTPGSGTWSCKHRRVRRCSASTGFETAVSYTDYLHVEVEENVPYPGIHVVSLEGELDAFVASYVVDRLCEIGGLTLEVDLSRLKLIDGGGVRALLEVKERIEQQGHKFRVRGAEGIVRRVFEVLHFEEWLE